MNQNGIDGAVFQDIPALRTFVWWVETPSLGIRSTLEAILMHCAHIDSVVVMVNNASKFLSVTWCMFKFVPGHHTFTTTLRRLDIVSSGIFGADNCVVPAHEHNETISNIERARPFLPNTQISLREQSRIVHQTVFSNTPA
jgi:hypothetical protein